MIDRTRTYRLQTKADFQQLMLDILEPLKGHYSEGCAQLRLGDTFAHYDIGATYMEAVSRPLWALVPYWAGGGREELSSRTETAADMTYGQKPKQIGTAAGQKPDRAEGTEKAAVTFAEIYHRALTHGTDPEHPEYWGKCSDFDQRFVEMAAIAYGLLYAPEVVWEPLSESEKAKLTAYLSQINKHPLPVCNWILFAVLVNIALKKVGRDYDERMLEEYLTGLESFYLGEGWYRDGDSGQKDYYVSFAIHFYTLIYAAQMDECDHERCERYRARSMEFAQQFIYWFDEGGDAIPFGRSLTYRFAQVSFFAACLVAGIEPFPVAVMKGLIVRHLQAWLRRPIFDRDGILTIGYGYPNLQMAEGYNAPGSPYWGMKAFAFLMLGDDHPFWKVESAAYPADIAGTACAMKHADMLVRHYGRHATAFVPGVHAYWGHGHSMEKYAKFAYDTKFSINVARSQYQLNEVSPNNMLVFETDGMFYVRQHSSESAIRTDSVYSKWSPLKVITVETTIIPTENGYIAEHEIESDIECRAYEFGFPIRRADFEDMGEQLVNGEDYSMVCNRDSYCRVSGGKGSYLYADPNTNLLYPRTAIPGVEYQIKKGRQSIRTVVEAGWKS